MGVAHQPWLGNLENNKLRESLPPSEPLWLADTLGGETDRYIGLPMNNGEAAWKLKRLHSPNGLEFMEHFLADLQPKKKVFFDVAAQSSFISKNPKALSSAYRIITHKDSSILAYSNTRSPSRNIFRRAHLSL